MLLHTDVVILQVAAITVEYRTPLMYYRRGGPFLFLKVTFFRLNGYVRAGHNEGQFENKGNTCPLWT